MIRDRKSLLGQSKSCSAKEASVERARPTAAIHDPSPRERKRRLSNFNATLKATPHLIDSGTPTPAAPPRQPIERPDT